jgi:hypothetical protein
MLRRVAVVRTDVSEELRACINRVTRIDELGTTFLVTLMMEALCSSELSALTTDIWRNIPEEAILHTRRHEDLKSYEIFLVQN